MRAYKTLLSVLFSCLLIAGCSILQGKSTTSQYATDSGITTQIKTKLVQSDMLSAPNIHVETQNGVVQLSGFVSNAQQVQEAQNIAYSINNVKGVVNDLVIAPKVYKKRS